MIKPHGTDDLIPLIVADSSQRQALHSEAEQLPSIVLNSAAAANAVMLGAGYFSPLPGYMNSADAISVAENMHTTAGLFWPVPCLNRTNDISAIPNTGKIALRDPNIDGTLRRWIWRTRPSPDRVRVVRCR